jgi:hypothetical protein
MAVLTASGTGSHQVGLWFRTHQHRVMGFYAGGALCFVQGLGCGVYSARLRWLN